MESGPVQQACTTCMRPSCCGYVIMYIRESEGQTRFIDSVGLSAIFGTRTNKAPPWAARWELQWADWLVQPWDPQRYHGGQKSEVDKQSEQKTHATRHEGKDRLALPE